MTVIDSQRWSRPLDPTRLVLATDLDGTLPVNPYDANAMSETLYRALARQDGPAAGRDERAAA